MLAIQQFVQKANEFGLQDDQSIHSLDIPHFTGSLYNGEQINTFKQAIK